MVVGDATCHIAKQAGTRVTPAAIPGSKGGDEFCLLAERGASAAEEGSAEGGQYGCAMLTTTVAVGGLLASHLPMLYNEALPHV